MRQLAAFAAVANLVVGSRNWGHLTVGGCPVQVEVSTTWTGAVVVTQLTGSVPLRGTPACRQAKLKRQQRLPLSLGRIACLMEP